MTTTVFAQVCPENREQALKNPYEVALMLQRTVLIYSGRDSGKMARYRGDDTPEIWLNGYCTICGAQCQFLVALSQFLEDPYTAVVCGTKGVGQDGLPNHFASEGHWDRYKQLDYISAVQGDPAQWANFARHMRKYLFGAPTAQEFHMKLADGETAVNDDGETVSQVRRAVWCNGIPYPSVDMVRVFWGQHFGGLSRRCFTLRPRAST